MVVKNNGFWKINKFSQKKGKTGINVETSIAEFY